MTIKHNNKMFTIDERERFKKRKSKKYKNLCSIAVTTMVVAGVAMATTVKADEIATTTTEVVTPTISAPLEVSPVVESSAPSTNLTEVQPEPSEEAVATQGAEDTQAGNILISNVSNELNEAVARAEQEGVQVKQEATKDYGITTSTEETAEKLTEIEADYTKQAEDITKVTDAYVAEKTAHAEETEKIVAENKRIEQQNQKATEAYNKAMEVYKADKERYDKSVETATASTAVEGNLSEVTAQSLIFNREPNATATISGQQTFFGWENGDDGLGVINASKAQHVGAGHTVSSPFWADVLAPGGTGGGTGETGRVQATVLGLGKGESTTVSYTNLANSSYGGRKISRVDYTYTVLSSPSSDESFTMVVYKDPTITTYFGTAKDGDAMRDGKIQMDVTYYYEDGSPVVFDKDAALLSFSSLNRTELPIGEQEYVSGLTNVTPIQITGSSIVYQDGKLGALSSNNSKEHGSKFDRGEWDSTAENPNSYYGAGAAKINSGTQTISFVIGNHPTEAGTRGTLRQWFQFNSEVRTTGGIIGTPPKEPVLKLKDPKELPEAPEKPTVSYHLATLKTQPQTEKTVKTAEGVNVDKGLVAKGQEIVFDLTIDSLPANRSLTTSGEVTDPLPKGFILNLEKTVNASSGYELAYSENNHVLTGRFTKETIQSLNTDLTKVAQIPKIRVYGWVSNDAATYKNAFTLEFNGGEGKVNGYTRTSNKVVVHTPGNPNDPDNPTNNEIIPLKANTNANGVKIDGKVVPIGGVNYYTITLDYDQYNAVKADKETIAKGFGAFDDYPEEALQVDLSKATAIDSDGNVVSGLTFTDNSSVETSSQTVQALLAGSAIGDKIKGAFISVTADDPLAYYESIVKAKKSVTITIPMIVKDSLYNTGNSYSNIAYQLDYGNGYRTNTVTNTTPVVTPTKVNTNASGAVINGKYVLANSVNYYKVSLDYSHYKGIEADPSLITQGFFGADDYPEEALTVENSGIQLIASDNSLVKGVTTSIYANILEAPKALQEAMEKQGFKPKGAVLVFSADNPQDFYDTYVKTGMTITATLPMTVKADMAKTGGQYENTAYQVDFGSAYVTETVVNNVPKLDPKKDVVVDLSHSTESLAGKDIELGTVFNYKLSGAELPANRGSEIFAYTWYDDYDEKHDQYDGVYKIYAATAFETEDGTRYAAGTDLTRFSIQTVDTKNGEVFTRLDESFLRSISDLSVFKTDKYMQVKRIATGDVHNTYTHGVNDAKVDSDTVTTHTPVGNVLVNFLEDGTGNILKAQVIDEKEVATGTAYDTTDRKVIEIVTEDGKTYELIRTEGQEQGKVVKGDTIVNYIYKEVKADVLVNYVDEDGNVIKTQVKDVDQGSTGSDYDTTDNKPEYIEVDGVKYKLMPKKTIGKETGKLTKDGAEVTYVYHKIVTNWVEEGTRKSLKPQEDGEQDQGSFEDYSFVVTEIDEETGDITHIFKQVPKPVVTPSQPVHSPQPQESTPVVAAATLPSTGESDSVAVTALGFVALTGATGLAFKKRHKQED
ncbi:SspB-related isopeptide-forming adhesin [Streptococcus suis]